MSPSRCAVVLLALLVTGCIQPYRLEVPQGNVVTEEMIDLLKPGMTKRQVRFALGTPLITDPFHQDRWDYVYLYKKHADAPAETRRLTVIFEDDVLARLEGDMAPAAGGPANKRAGTAAGSDADPSG